MPGWVQPYAELRVQLLEAETEEDASANSFNSRLDRKTHSGGFGVEVTNCKRARSSVCVRLRTTFQKTS